MLEKKDHVKRIQEITFEAYKSSGRIAALLVAFADAVIFPAGMLIVAYLGAGSAPLTLLITPLVTFFCLAAGIVLYVLSRLVADAAALREDNDLTI